MLIGYGDGYPRRLSNRGEMLLHGRRAPILGRVCMDQTVVDVTDIPGVAAGDVAVCIGAPLPISPHARSHELRDAAHAAVQDLVNDARVRCDGSG